MTVEELALLDATATAEAVRAGDVTASEVLEATIARVERLNPALNAVIHRLDDDARRAIARGLPDGPFSGVPFLFKDLVATRAGDPYHMGNRALKDARYRATQTTAFARRITDAGFVTVGKTNTPEFGTLPTTEPAAYGATRNPWNLDYSPAGSSGGSAAAVAAGIVPMASAGDGGGSIRLPAAACGLVGLKPSRGRVSTAPAGEVWAGAACELVVTRTVRDTAGALDVLAGPEPGERYPMAVPSVDYRDLLDDEPTGLRIGISPGLDGLALDPAVAEALDAIGPVLTSLGHHVEVDQPAALAERDPGRNFSAVITACAAQDRAHLAAMLGRPVTPDDVEPLDWQMAERGAAMSAERFLLAREWWDTLGRRMGAWFTAHDVLVTPTMPRTATPLGWFDDPATVGRRTFDLVAYTWPFNVTGQPAISLPLYHSPDGFPIGLQFVAAIGREDLLLRLAAQLEAALPWSDRRPTA